jgi:2-oxoglutarate/2-oxoacid ferredoxin oxidoreductase subunit beta
MTGTATEGAVLPRVEFDTQVCKGCGVCIEACPEDIIEFADVFNHRGVKPTRLVEGGLVRCTACGNCAVVCPDSAVEVENRKKPLRYGRSPLRVGEMHYCPGCDEGTVHELLAEVIDELGIRERTVGVASVGCTVFAYRYIDIDWHQAAHGRATSVAWGIECQHPELRVFTLQGDGDLAGIGMGETIHAAARGDPTVIIFLNNGIYGMTGGQMAPTTLLGQKTTTSPAGRSAALQGYPVVMTEIMAAQAGCSFAVRTTVHDAPAIRRTKKYIRQAFLNQEKNRSLSVVEVVSACPSGWKLDPVDAHRYLVREMLPVYKPGVIKEPPGGMPR